MNNIQEGDTSGDPSYTKNIIIMSIGFFGIFMAFNTAQSLATSYLKGNLGSVCLSVLYITFCLSCIPAPRIINILGPTKAMMLGSCAYFLMVLSFLYPSYGLSVPAHFLVGLSAPLLWGGSSIYISRCALLESMKKYDEDVAKYTSNFNGLFFSLFNFNGFCGLVMSSIILSLVGDNSKKLLFVVLSVIGVVGTVVVSFTPSVEKPVSSPIATVHRTMSTPDGDVYPINLDDHFAEIDPLTNDSDAEVNTVPVLQTLKLSFTDSRLALFIPAIFYNGLSMAFMLGDVSKLIITRTLGMKKLGYVMGGYYILNTIFTFVLGKFASKPLIKKFILTFACIAHLGFLACIYFPKYSHNFDMNGDDEVVIGSASTNEYILIATLTVFFSLGDCVFQAIIPSTLQTIFNREPANSDAAMAALKLWQSLGLSLQFILGVLVGDNLNLRVLLLLIHLVFTLVCVLVLAFKYLGKDNQEEFLLFDETSDLIHDIPSSSKNIY